MTTSTLPRRTASRPTIDDFDAERADITPGTAGRFHVTVPWRGGRIVIATFRSADDAGEFLYGPESYEGPSCSICDGLGHGYPGGGPCPLEETGEDDPRERLLWAMEDERMYLSECQA